MSYQYDLYLAQHKANVKKGFEWLRDNIPEIIKLCDGEFLEWQIGFQHDQTKSKPDEYDAYDAYFYGNNKSYSVIQNFNKAWLLHIHRNPHHWQYWVLINDDPQEKGMIILDMPDNYIIEMICDWWAFSWKDNKLSEIFNWYEQHKDYMKLSDITRRTVEYILNQIKVKLEGE